MPQHYHSGLRRHLRQRFVFEGEDEGRGQQQNAAADDAEEHRHGELRLHQTAQHRGVDLVWITAKDPWAFGIGSVHKPLGSG